MTPAYILSRGAAEDLREITRYTHRERGTEQCRAYLQQIENAATELALGEGVFRTRDDLYPGVRVRRAGHHYIFCLPRPDEPALILAILHERMDLIARLSERLA
ncbi:type II toxin-antitoxin system RelE/ParE family toxin [Halochromatium roseum]|uniref:type II toxin-antitoxin system RelE/ParE family toxin n=1 Tax=Halochromatium roseum TaxID=391920 RepID=UPI001913D9BE|nr:type II toxin-antitoxin system RelE/ParE family toxin [Halochromatium roseum]MBK5937724.1 plasmid stabilization protein ParE [Halochromatium roseum]